MKKLLKISFGVLLVLLSAALAAYPFVSNYLSQNSSQSTVLAYIEDCQDISSDEYEQMLAAAHSYNQTLLGSVTLSDPFSQDDETSTEYSGLLNVSASGVMATIRIPAIDVNLPIYHGTSDSVMQVGIGHMSTSSLPVGGTGTHAVLTGHSGLSTNRLFTDLDQLVVGDVFFITVLGDTLAYEVDKIETVLPTEVDSLAIDPAEDYVTLVTCTPYGVNTHRLLVRGTRTDLQSALAKAENSSAGSTWNNYYLYAILLGIGILAAILIVYFSAKHIADKLKKRKAND